MSIINGVGRVGWKNYVATSPSYLLDTYTSATVGYSLRKLSSAYTGSAIRVRRSSDNTEQNIGFDGSGNLDTTSLLAFVGAGDGYVTTWYDQSGDISNNNPSWPGYTNKTMIQTSAANQPIIVTSGVVELKSGKPTIKFSANKYLKLPIIGLTNTLMFDGADHSFFAVYEKDTTANVSNFIGYNVGYLWLDYGGTQYDGNNSVSGTIPANTTKLISLSNTWSTTQKFYMNNALLGTRTGSGVGGCDMYYIGYPSHSYTQYFSEIIMYRNAQTSNISNINNAINTYYSIYPTYPTSLKLFIDAGNPLSYSGTGTTVTDLTGTQNGTLVNGTSYNSADGGSFVFDGINDYITFGTNAAIKPTTRGTISMMAKFTHTYGWGELFRNYDANSKNGVGIWQDNSPTRWYIASGSGSQYTNFDNIPRKNIWALFTLTWSGTTVKVYVNNALTYQATQNVQVTLSTAETILSHTSWPLKGNISYLKIYDVSRSQAEITADFNEIKTRYGL